MQGMQVFASTHDAWGGFTSRYLERIRDEYGKVPVWVWGIEDLEQKQAVSRYAICGLLKFFGSN